MQKSQVAASEVATVVAAAAIELASRVCVCVCVSIINVIALTVLNAPPVFSHVRSRRVSTQGSAGVSPAKRLERGQLGHAPCRLSNMQL